MRKTHWTMTLLAVMFLGEVVGWRQDWGERSIHPMAQRMESVAEWRAGAAS